MDARLSEFQFVLLPLAADGPFYVSTSDIKCMRVPSVSEGIRRGRKV